MYHVALALPILALPVFWLFPFDVAAPVYAVAFALSAAMYAMAVKSMHLPVVTGKEELLHATGVVERIVDGAPSVIIRGEHWTADSEGQALQVGDRVKVLGIDGLTLHVRRKD
jgi:membrane protein implicated in regulation of membrane protease activity